MSKDKAHKNSQAEKTKDDEEEEEQEEDADEPEMIRRILPIPRQQPPEEGNHNDSRIRVLILGSGEVRRHLKESIHTNG